jgi:hypothetical protein
MTEEEQPALFEMKEPWEDVWVGMPEFNRAEIKPTKQLIVHFTTVADLMEFGELIGQKLTKKTKSIRFPPKENHDFQTKRWISK